MARLRWEALARLERWGAIEQDYDRVSHLVRVEEEEAWLYLAVSLFRWIAWGRGDDRADELSDRIRDDIHSLGHLGLRNSYYFDQADLQDATAKSWQWVWSKDRWSENFLTLMRDGWARPMEQLRGDFEALLKDIADRPARWLEWFDYLTPEGTVVLLHFANLLAAYQSEFADDYGLELTAEQVRILAYEEVGARARDSRRGEALQFCIATGLSPLLVREAYLQAPGGPEALPGWVETMASDLPMQLVCHAIRVLRA